MLKNVTKTRKREREKAGKTRMGGWDVDKINIFSRF